MKKPSRDFLFYLEDILAAIVKIQQYTAGVSIKQFEEDSMRQDAIIRNLEIIGEAAKHIPDHVKTAFPNVPWDDMYRLRNIFIHQYFGIDLTIVWRIVSFHLPTNKKDIEAVIAYYQNL
ncbi:DUF86 domain-containing protein [Nibrella viscosa]|uniref:DUF86 domain-containing protein n=1 Tax=Nibrella viscosa TaxID=1084524 RepID=A0ABP8KIU9_9BACT